MSSLSLGDLLDGLSKQELLALALKAHPEARESIQKSGSHLAWLLMHAKIDSILPHLPTTHLKTLMERQRTANAFADSFTPARLVRLEKDLAKTQSVLKTRAREYVDEIEDLEWDAPRQTWEATVIGSSAYVMHIHADKGFVHCTCPAFDSYGECKHVTALRLRLLKEARKIIVPMEGGAPTAPPDAIKLPAVAPAVHSEAPKPAVDVQPTPRRDPHADYAVAMQLFALSQTLAPSTRPEYARKAAAYVLRVHPPRVQDITLHACESSFTQKRGWEVQFQTNLNRSQSLHRIRYTPPEWVTKADRDLILALGCNESYERTPRTLAPQTLLAMAHATGNLFDQAGQSLALDPDLWTFRPSLVDAEGMSRFTYALQSLSENPRSLTLEEGWHLIGEEGSWIAFVGTTIHRLDPRTPTALIELARDNRALPASVPTPFLLEQAKASLQALGKVGLALPQAFRPERLEEKPLRTISVSAELSGAALTFLPTYPSIALAPNQDADLIAFTRENGEMAELERDLESEGRLCQEVTDLLVEAGVEFLLTEGGWSIEAPQSLPRLALAALPKLLEQGWEVREAKLLERWKRRGAVVQVSGKASGQDWFELQAIVNFDEYEVPLSTLVKHVGNDYRLPDGSIGELPEALLKRLRWLGRLGEKTQDGIRLRGIHASLAQDLVTSGLAHAKNSPDWDRELATALSRPVVTISVPSSLQAELRPYQKDGLQWLASLRAQGLGGILADDMGLGKTVQVIAYLCHLFDADPAATPALVVAPASVAGNWISELARFAPHLRTRLLHGLNRDELRDAPLEGPTIFVTTFGTLPREMDWALRHEFSLVVLDESQAIRNPLTHIHETCLQLRATQRLCLTGTPIENSLADLWAQFSFLNPGLLGPQAEFVQQFQPTPGEKLDLSRLRQLTAPFWLRRTKEVVARDLPPRQDIVLPVEMDPKQTALYVRQLKEYQKNLVPQIRKTGLNQGGRFEVLTALLRLRQLACAPELAGHRGPSAKLDLLMEKLEEDLAEGHKALVFSSFTSLLDLVQKRLTKAGMSFLRLDGSTPAAQRTRSIKAFQQGDEASIFLVSLKAGGAGINLTAADYVFLLDPWWNPAIEEQAAARAHRIGQDRPVTLYRMVSKGTIEERVLALSRTKAELAGQLFDSGESGGAALTPEVVQELLS